MEREDILQHELAGVLQEAGARLLGRAFHAKGNRAALSPAPLFKRPSVLMPVAIRGCFGHCVLMPLNVEPYYVVPFGKKAFSPSAKSTKEIDTQRLFAQSGLSSFVGLRLGRGAADTLCHLRIAAHGFIAR